jgi:hypothetical protein
MKKYITLAAAGLFLLSLQPARAQRQVQPLAVPPLLETDRPLTQPEAPREPTAPKQAETSKAKARTKTRTKADRKKGSKRAAEKKRTHKKGAKAVKKKGKKSHKKKTPEKTGLKRRNRTAVS